MANTKSEKSDIVTKIINHIREASNCGDGIFVKEARANNRRIADKKESSSSAGAPIEWWEVDEAFAREKIGCMFRDLLHNQYQSSSKAKQARKKVHAAVAAQEGHLEVVRWLVQEGKAAVNEAGITPLFAAAHKGHLEVVRWLV